MIKLIIALFIIVTILVGIVAFLISTRNDKKLPEIKDNKKELENLDENIKIVNEKIEVIKNEKSNNATDCSNRLNSMDI